MPKFTVAIPDDLLASARVAAAKSGVSLSVIIRTLLEGFVKNEAGPMKLFSGTALEKSLRSKQCMSCIWTPMNNYAS